MENGCYNIVSISASKHSFVVVMSTKLGRDASHRREFSWPSWRGKSEGEDEEGNEKEKERKEKMN
ncbi:hypothetical protein BDZ45DRAFT_464321 [Acephala macrosclerotiorum]|nr:hypothetical protein BDZ45DRAFT_464321 [Acephala macrosclerotiorum]